MEAIPRQMKQNFIDSIGGLHFSTLGELQVRAELTPETTATKWHEQLIVMKG